VTKLVKLDPDNFQKELSLLKNLFKARFPEPKRPLNPQGAPRKWPRWLIMTLGLLGASFDFTWQEYTLQLKKIEEILVKFGAVEAPKKTSLYNAWKSLSPHQIKSLTTQVARILILPDEDTAIDSSGFILKVGSIWRYIKYKRSELKRSSKRFYKFHIIISTKSKTILAVDWSKSPEHDYPEGRKLIKKVGRRLFSKINRNYGDKAYNGKPFTNDLAELGVRHIVEPKSNAVDRGTDTVRDRSLRLYRNSPGLWKYTFKHGRKSAVEQVFGEIKIRNNTLNSRKRHLLKKQILLQFLLYNLDKAMELENWR
jgi:hypothetical protein